MLMVLSKIGTGKFRCVGYKNIFTLQSLSEVTTLRIMSGSFPAVLWQKMIR
jgi:hypothetical protein